MLRGRSGSGQSAGGEGRFASSESVVGRGWGLKPRPSALNRDYGEVSILEAYDARRGTVVRVKEGYWKSEFAGMLGTIQSCSGQSEHAVVDVLLQDRRSELFWLSDLEVADRAVAV